ncbi:MULTISPECIES: carbohydrate ABC transporter permease [unclassified Mesorhizobium]|uniref:carbohydrate ABC transporter permease n=1 Tax=unclassified Mesorhizobium TaxID=325217 RepID=UPI000FDAA22D|nr:MULTISPECIES: carbohydrate ABC transporter permease [unclassified Mesorhizobium]TGQ45798.1 carbohydrate ABC transporter permease [Mesorhizobium sp. M00.F.Ca.ET.216.01.1.1]TIS56354.1 MAG: ABC transporter permease subunit [Mesorhizobium sp.]TIS90960.1 MAG: ABC transporter permease subunit [Mesorhizobium sp.]TJW12955.1 MAG: ABC transporter permease subunit [Mesorhizobium sp.]TJW48065.1 MAG: ABC transporter permease subunit [Mesorhizobium sp.]
MSDATFATAADAIEPPTERSRLLSIAIHTALIAASIVMLYPLIWMLAGSVKDQNEIFGTASLVPSHFDFSSYIRGWEGTQVSFGKFFWNSLVIAVLSVIGNVMSCSLAAFAFARLKFWGRNFWFALMLGTLMLPYHVTLIPQYILFLELGWVKTFLPLVVPKFLAVDAFFIFLMVQFFRGIPRELDEAAMMDGCSAWRIYWKVMLPLSLPVLATAAIFSFLWTWDDFFGPLIYLSDINTYTVQLGLRSFVDSTGSSDWSGLFAMSSLSLVPVFLIFLFFQRLLIEGIATAGLKR